MAERDAHAFPALLGKQHRRFAWLIFGCLGMILGIALFVPFDRDDSGQWISLALIVVFFLGSGWHYWRTAAWFDRFRVAVDRDGLTVDGKSIPWTAIARVRERGFGIELLDAERLRIVHLRYWLEGFEDLLAEIFRHRLDLLEPATPSRVGNVSIRPDRLEIAARLRPKSIPIDQLQRPALQLELNPSFARLEVWVDWPGGETSRLRIPSHDPIQLWIALRRAIRGPAIPAI